MQKTIRGILGVGILVGCSQAAIAADWEVTGDLRERYQSFNNLDFNSAVDKDSWELNSRLYIKAKVDFDNGVTAFFQPQAVHSASHTSAAGTVDLTQADFLQAYIDYDMKGVGIRLGRQQLVYGDQRLLGHLGWKDVARTFDGLKLSYKKEALQIDAFLVHPADIVSMTPTVASPQGSSLVTWEDRTLAGLYGTYTVAPETGVDAYFINWSHADTANVGVGRSVNTFGARAFGKWDKIDATAESVFQNGDWATGVTQSASAYAVKAGYTLDKWATRVGIEYDYSPGDDKKDASTHKDFVFPFHTNHAHYGEMDRFSWANMKDLRLSVKSSPSPVLTLMGNLHFFSLDKATGDWLNVVGAGALYAGNPAYTETEAGTEIDLKVVYKVLSIKGLTLVANYSVFNPGAAVLERTGSDDKASFGYLITNYKF